jgi:hypothetical protein
MYKPPGTVRESLLKAADLLLTGHTWRAHARYLNGNVCAIFDPHATRYSMYGALARAVGPDKGGDVKFQHSIAYFMISIKALEYCEFMKFPCYSRSTVLMELTDILGPGGTQCHEQFRIWAEDPRLQTIGEWK